MARQTPPRDPKAMYRRETVAARRFGIGEKCACGESRPEALIAGTKPTMCCECDRKTHGRKTRDDHHLFGKANSPLTMSILANDHRACLNTAQYAWPRKTLENKDGSERLAGAAVIRGFTDTMLYLLREHLLPVADILEHLDTIVRKKLRKVSRKRRS